MKRMLMMLACFSLVTVVHGQTPDASWKAEMERLAPMVGEWRGEGWAQMGREGRSTFTIHETIEPRVGGRALLIQGEGRAIEEDGSEGRIVHEALAVVSWSPESNSYRFDAHSAQGGRAEANLVINDDGSMVWGFETPRGEIRYTITTDAGHWHELGEFQPKGNESWMQFMEMKLDRVK